MSRRAPGSRTPFLIAPKDAGYRLPRARYVVVLKKTPGFLREV